MKLIQTIIALSAVLGSSVGWGAEQKTLYPQLIEYHLEKNRYAVVVIVNGMTYKEAFRVASKKAAEVCADNGYSYYSIVSKTKGGATYDYAFLGRETNLYQEVIVEQDFGREKVLESQQQRSGKGIQLAVRIVFDCIHKKER